jgi:hypothetical protein
VLRKTAAFSRVGSTSLAFVFVAPLARTLTPRSVSAVFLNWFKREDAVQHEAWFVERVRVRRPLRPLDAFVVGGWLLILVKCVLASIAIRRWEIPVHEIYVWGPSVLLGAVCTLLYLRREE